MSLLQTFKNSSFIRNSLTLIFGTALAQLIPIILQPILRRSYSPEEFGFISIYITIVGMFAAIANFKYESAIVIPKEKKEADHLVLIGLFLSFVVSSILFLGMILFEDNWSLLLKIETKYIWIFYCIPFSVFIVSGFKCLNMYLIRNNAFKKSSRNKVLRRSTEGAIQVALGLKKNHYGLFTGMIIGDFINFLASLLQSIKLGFNTKNIQIHEIITTAKKHWKFPFYHALPSLLNTISLTLPVLIIHEFYGEYQTGQYDLSRLILSLPMALISISLSQVYLQNAARKIQNSESIIKLFNQTFFTLFMISIPIVLIVYFFSEPLFEVFFGPQWNDAAKMTSLLIFSQALKFIVSPLSSSLIALSDVKYSALWQTCYFLLIGSLFFIKDMNLYELLTIYLVIDLLAYSIYYFIIRYRILQYERTKTIKDD